MGRVNTRRSPYPQARNARLLDAPHRNDARDIAEFHIVAAGAATADHGAIGEGWQRQPADRVAVGGLLPHLPIVQVHNNIALVELIADHTRTDLVDPVAVHGDGIGVAATIGDALTAELRGRGLRRPLGPATSE